ncbi:MAG: MFS transporter [Pseudomonadota bacterium]
MPHSQFDILKARRFLPLFLTQFLGAFNDNVYKNALVILITYVAADQADMDARLLVTAAAGIFILPFFLFSAIAGQLADKYEKSRMIRSVKLCEIVLMLAAALGFYLQDVYLLLTVLFLMGTQSSFFGPLKYSILPDHLHEEELIGGNGLVEAGTFLAILLGTILGGVLVLKSGGIAIVSSIVILIAVIGWLCSRAIPPTLPAAPDLKISYNFIAQAWHIISETRRNRQVFKAVVGISWFWLVGFVFLAQFPIFGKDIIGANEDVVTLFLTIFSIGIALGSLVCNRLLKGEIKATLAGTGALGMAVFTSLLYLVAPAPLAPALAEDAAYITLLEFLSQPQSWAILGAMLGISISGGVYVVPLYAVMQTRCLPGFRARTIAANNILNAVFMVAGALITMAMLALDLLITEIFLTLGLANFLVSFLLWYRGRP